MFGTFYGNNPIDLSLSICFSHWITNHTSNEENLEDVCISVMCTVFEMKTLFIIIAKQKKNLALFMNIYFDCWTAHDNTFHIKNFVESYQLTKSLIRFLIDRKRKKFFNISLLQLELNLRYLVRYSSVNWIFQV